MVDPEELRIGEYEKIIGAAAYMFRKAAEYDDLYQEGMIAVWLSPPDADPKYVNSIVYNRMKDWVRFVKRQRHFQAADYVEIMGEDDEVEDDDGTELYDEDSRESTS